MNNEKQKATRIKGERVHFLKTWPEPFGRIKIGRKTLEIRAFDRDFRENDILILFEFTHNGRFDETGATLGYYSGEYAAVIVTDITEGFGLKFQYCALSVSRIGLQDELLYQVENELSKITNRITI